MKSFFLLCAATCCIVGCKKSSDEFPITSSYTIVNATIDVASSKAYASERTLFWSAMTSANAIAQYRFAHYGVLPIENNIRAVNNADTTKVLFSSTKPEKFEAGKLNTIFLCGNSTVGYEGVYLNNESPVNFTDSVIGIRFINLSPNSSPLNITLSTTPTVNEVAGIAYKQKTDYKPYPSLSTTPSMVFQIRDAGGVLLASYTLPVTPASPYTMVGINFSRFKTITLVIKGLQGTSSGTNALGIFPVAHYL